ncbi:MULTISPECIES: bifunctional hydroxymethylpyrimidine kinase/phosphomethylpyrimidine kinase [unclassified Solwaraspora]|uniref:bifunctional hydroxymethylpyrimidine kinase/phosphomethylpyrimidine kinase n=1 Tax=unclassified Solwaraspora TaxID=2627926 RepID=UPI00259B1BFB|nr:bifunctional hydroxymethylpyrimidine kinase/phosphomethylpyrimidine kinase [Solwaraspora sp. WMMA2056]WJK42316.1 bifunctional hydroxymethylpyrimidine kinase/phosphomethylpyrimidine kinase [Solwaraspora sp. WMMA2056]
MTGDRTTPVVAMTIAGSDSGGGAGIQADLKVFAALGVHGTSAITAVTAQNTRGVTAVHQLPAGQVRAQIEAVRVDLPVAAVKTGMLGTARVAGVVAALARAGELPNLVVDPVLVSTSGHRLGVVGAVERLLPYALVATPNRAEASALVGWPVRTREEMARAAAELVAGGPRFVVVTGGDPDGTSTDPAAVDVVATADSSWQLTGERLATRNTHGTGCSFAAAVAARLALGDDVPAALIFAKGYVAGALAGAAHWRLGAGHGPVDHFGWSRQPLST